MNSKIVVLGSSGQLGREFQKNIAKSCDSSFRFFFADRSHYAANGELELRSFLDQIQPDGIINCIAYTKVDQAESDSQEAFRINAKLVEDLANYSRSNGIGVIHFSTDYVFDGRKPLAYVETDEVAPLSVYGKSKAAGERTLLDDGCKGAVFRTSWLYSNSCANFYKTILRLANQRPVLQIVADQIGTPTYAGNLTDAVLTNLTGLLNGPTELYHFSDEGVASWFDFATAIVRNSGSPCAVEPIETSSYPTAAQRPHFSVMSKKKFKSRFNSKIPHWSQALEACFQEALTRG